MKPETLASLHLAEAEVRKRKEAGWTQKDFALALTHSLKTGKDLPIKPRPSEIT